MNSKLKYSIYALIGLIILAGIMIGVPLLVNTIIGMPTPNSFTLHGKTEGWHNFWAVYLGAIIGAIVPFIILYTTIQSNKVENKRNRDIQINTIKYQTKISWINKLKDVLIHVIDAFDENIARDLLSQFKEHSKYQDFSSFYFKSEEKIKLASFSIETILLGCTNPIETQFMDIFRDFRFRYQFYIDDVIFLLQYPNNYKNPENIDNTEYFKKELLKYKKRSLKRENGNPERIWEIAEKYDFKLISKRDDILQELFRWADTHFFKIKCKELLHAEYKIAESLLKNGTE